MKLFLFVFMCFVVTTSRAQKGDTITIGNRQVINPVKSKFWGNSTYFSQGINFARNKEFEFGIGRTKGITIKGSRGLFFTTTNSWGFNYALTDVPRKQIRQSIKGFYEFGFIPAILVGDILLRGEYIYQMNNGQHYVRPSVGVTLLFLDLSYNYSFLLNQPGRENLYRHGFSIRFKQFVRMKNWEVRRRIDTP